MHLIDVAENYDVLIYLTYDLFSSKILVKQLIKIKYFKTNVDQIIMKNCMNELSIHTRIDTKLNLHLIVVEVNIVSIYSISGYIVKTL